MEIKIKKNRWVNGGHCESRQKIVKKLRPTLNLLTLRPLKKSMNSIFLVSSPVLIQVSFLNDNSIFKIIKLKNIAEISQFVIFELRENSLMQIKTWKKSYFCLSASVTAETQQKIKYSNNHSILFIVNYSY